MQDHGRFVCAFALMSIYAVHLQAQTVGAELSGTVRDPAGAVVAGVSISLRNVGTNQTIQTVSNDKGVYRVGPLSPGRYEVTVEAPGFRRSVVRDVELTVGQSATLNLSLQVQVLTEAVEVKAEVALVEPTKTELTRISH